MAVPTRRRDRDRSDEEARTPTVWKPFAPLPWDPEPLERLHTLSRLLDELARAWPGPPHVSAEGVSTPLGDLEELDDAWLIHAELPGVKPDDIDVQLDGRRLLVRAERKQTERKGLLRRTTRTTGRYFLEVTLPGEADRDDVDATLEDGVLTVRVAKHAAEQGGFRRIPVREPDADRETSG